MKFTGYWIRSGRTDTYFGQDHSESTSKWVTEKRKAFRFPTSNAALAFAASHVLSSMDGEFVIESAEGEDNEV